MIAVIIGFVMLSVGFYLFSVVYASHCIYIQTLSRRTKEQWGREVSCQEEIQLKMDAIGIEWHKQNASRKKDVHIINNGLNLYGEYYDNGSKNAVMILSGRTESLRYGYYFAKPYWDAGLNVLVVDPRAHGFSDGKYNTFGFEESKDDLAWAEFLNKELGVENIVFHGICIGSAGGMLAITSPQCPKCVKALVTEGMFPRFAESMKNHLTERKKLMFPIMQCIDHWMKHYGGHSMNYGPIDVIEKMDKPLLMIHSKEDKYSTPSYAQIMYDMCPSKEKQLVWYENGAHSQLRITDTEKYDATITAFLQKLDLTNNK